MHCGRCLRAERRGPVLAVRAPGAKGLRSSHDTRGGCAGRGAERLPFVKRGRRREAATAVGLRPRRCASTPTRHAQARAPPVPREDDALVVEAPVAQPQAPPGYSASARIASGCACRHTDKLSHGLRAVSPRPWPPRRDTQGARRRFVTADSPLRASTGAGPGRAFAPIGPAV